jgi:hypothetical protein
MWLGGLVAWQSVRGRLRLEALGETELADSDDMVRSSGEKTLPVLPLRMENR